MQLEPGSFRVQAGTATFEIENMAQLAINAIDDINKIRSMLERRLQKQPEAAQFFHPVVKILDKGSARLLQERTKLGRKITPAAKTAGQGRFKRFRALVDDKGFTSRAQAKRAAREDPSFKLEVRDIWGYVPSDRTLDRALGETSIHGKPGRPRKK